MLLQRTPVEDVRNWTGTEQVIYFDQISLESKVATLNSVDPTKLSITVGGDTIDFDLTGEGTATIPVVAVKP